MKNIILYIILGSSIVFNSYFFYKNNLLKEQVKFLEQENENLKETPEIYWQNAIENFNNKNYTETKEILNKLIEKFSTSSLVKNSQEKINEINLIEKKKKEEEQRIIKSLHKQIANAKNTLTIEKILNDLDNKYDTSYSELKKVIKDERDKIRTQIEREKQKELENKLGGGYKSLKWGITRQQARKLINKRVYEEYSNALQFRLAEFEDLYLFFYKGKFYKAVYEIYIKPEKDEYHIKLLNELTNRFQEKPVETKNLSIRHGLVDMPIRYFYWEDKYTVVSLSYYDFEKEWTAKDINILTITYESKKISNEKKQDEYNKAQQEKEQQQQEQERNSNRIMNNL